MTLFDNYFISIRNFIDDSKKKNRQVRKFSIPPNLNGLNGFLEENYRPGSNSNIVLKSETILELGSPSTGSCAMTIYTNNTTLQKDSEITLIGPDVGETKTSGLPFAQIIMTAGKDLGDDDYHKLCRYPNKPDLIKGYMIKSTPENIWSRVSYKAADSGFNFKLLGAAIAKRIKSEFPKVTSVNILFVTSSKEDVLWLHHMGAEIRGLAQKIKEKVWKKRGINILECNQYGHCGLCKDRDVCETIAKLAKNNKRGNMK